VEGLSTTKIKIMKTFELTGNVREALGKKDSGKLRGEGKVPCVLFGTEEPVHFWVEKPNIKKLIYTPHVYLVNLEIGKKKIQSIMKDIQFDPVTDEVMHIDFKKISDDKPIKIDIPVEVEGFAKGIRSGGKLQVEVRRLKVMALPKYLPDSIKIDVTPLELGQSMRVGDLKFDNISILNGKSVPVVRIMITRAARAAQATTEVKGKK
jgi:large subunit ribosomal protein L25